MSDTWWIATFLLYLALVPHYLGDYERATELTEESMDLYREQGDKYSLAFCLNNLAMVVYSQGDLERAAKLTEEGVALFRELGNRGDVALGLCNLGWIALLQDDLGRAADIYRESLSLSWDAGLNPIVQRTLEGFACLAGAKGEAERAARLWLAVAVATLGVLSVGGAAAATMPASTRLDVPALGPRRTRRATPSSGSRRRPVSTTPAAPSRASASAAASPMPLPAPVTQTILPSSLPIGPSLPRASYQGAPLQVTGSGKPGVRYLNRP